MALYECPECGLKGMPKGDGYCPCKVDGRVELVEMKKRIEPTPARLQVVDGDFFHSDGC